MSKTCCLLFVLLTFLIYPLSAQESGDTDKKLSAEDSIILARHILEAKKELATYTYEGDSSLLTPDQIDSILSVGYDEIHDGTVYYAPDGSFKIFIVEGEFCGAHCSPFWQSYLHLKTYPGKAFTEPYFNPIREIIAMPDDNYLIIQDAYERCGPTYCQTLTANLLTFIADSLVVYPWFYGNPRYDDGGEPEPSESFTIYQEQWIEEPIRLDYDKKKKRLSYRYCLPDHNEVDENGFFKAILYEGNFLYKDGGFVSQTGTAREIKVKEPADE